MEIDITGKKVGIWGFGAVGKSVLSFASQFPCTISVCDKRELDEFEKALLKGHNARLIPDTLLQQFLEVNDIIIPSPGIALTAYHDFHEKFVHEVDLFALNLKKQTIAITGSVGKTTTVKLLTHILNKLGIKTLAAGNVGLPLLDAVAQQDQYDMFVLELSSFQLQYQQLFAPDIAVLTNFYPNHLDHHLDTQEYLEAKGHLFLHQKPEQIAIIPLSFMDLFWNFTVGQKTSWIGTDSNANITNELSDITCHENWQLIIEVLEHLNLPTHNLKELSKDFAPLADRIELVATVNGVTFYNDSKSTLSISTVKAVERFNKPILFLGGLSKGVDRSILVKELAGKVKQILCFGKEAEQLHAFCKNENIKSSAHKTLEFAFKYCKDSAESNDVVLFSPAGSSYDLFKNYVERGKLFKELVNNYKNDSEQKNRKC
jgi:UDP-N-acetylmuramoylalanine--D-glutamate ligase